jgi:hypothetical protein
LLRRGKMEPSATPVEDHRATTGPEEAGAEQQLQALAAAVREHERATSERPYSVRYADLHLYRRLRQIAGVA